MASSPPGHSASPHSNTESDDINLLELFGVLLLYKWMIIILTTSFAIAAIGYALVSMTLPPEKSYLPDVYEPTAMILINEEDTGGLSSVLASTGLDDLASFARVSSGSSYGKLAEQLTKTRTSLDIVISEYEIADRYGVTSHIVGRSRLALLEHLSVKYDAGTSLLTIGYEDYDPEFAKSVVNRLVELLDDRFAYIGGNKNLARKNLLELKLAEVEAEITSLETQVQRFQREHGALDVETLAKEQVSTIAGLKSQLILRDMAIRTYTGFTQLDDPVIKRMRAERENLAILIDEMESGYSEYEALMPTQKDLPALAMEFEHLRRNLQIQATIFQVLTQQYELTKLNDEGEETIFQVLETAEAPDLKSGPSRGLICVAVTIAAFLFSVVLAFVLNGARNIKSDPEQMQKLHRA
jgi:tyrosine-protein kinase Etk/Wzc